MEKFYIKYTEEITSEIFDKITDKFISLGYKFEKHAGFENSYKSFKCNGYLRTATGGGLFSISENSYCIDNNPQSTQKEIFFSDFIKTDKKYLVGDYVTCIGNSSTANNGYCSAGWERDLTFRITRIDNSTNVLWGGKDDCGVYAIEGHVRLATIKEIGDLARKPKFKIGDLVKYTGKGHYYCTSDVPNSTLIGFCHKTSGINVYKITDVAYGKRNDFIWYKTKEYGNWDTEESFELASQKPEYVECTYASSRFTVGKIYKYPAVEDDKGHKMIDLPMEGGLWGFKPSTKKAFDSQVGINKQRFNSVTIKKTSMSYIPLVGDYVILEKAGGWGYSFSNNGCLGLIEQVEPYRKTLGISGTIINPKNKDKKFTSIPQIGNEGETVFRKATQKEIDDIVKKEEFKEGDWVVVLPEDAFYGNSEKGPQKILKIRGSDLKYSLAFRDGTSNSYNKIRKATKEEIDSVLPKKDPTPIWVPKVGEWVKITDDRLNKDKWGKLYQIIEIVNKDRFLIAVDYGTEKRSLYTTGTENGPECIKATEQEIMVHTGQMIFRPKAPKKQDLVSLAKEKFKAGDWFTSPENGKEYQVDSTLDFWTDFEENLVLVQTVGGIGQYVYYNNIWAVKLPIIEKSIIYTEKGCVKLSAPTGTDFWEQISSMGGSMSKNGINNTVEKVAAISGTVKTKQKKYKF